MEQTLETIIENGVEKLEEIATVKWSIHGNSKLTRNKIIVGLEKSYIKDITLYEALGYKTRNVFSKAINKAITNIPDRAKRINWKIYLLYLAGYKQCSKCKEIKEIIEFYTNKDNIYSECKECNKIHYQENKEEISIKNKTKRKSAVLLVIDLIKGLDRLPECELCGYRENWAVLEFHHIDPNLTRPEWGYTKEGKKRSPGNYILGCKNKETIKERFLKEANNLMLVCRNCHQDIEATSDIDRQKGLKLALEKLDIEYVCEFESCNESLYLHLHHNKREDKEISFKAFSEQSKERILKDGILEKELNKDVSILCGNHHKEIHNPIYNKEEFFNEKSINNEVS